MNLKVSLLVSFGSSLLVSKTVQSGKIIHNRCNFHFDSPEISVGKFSNEAKALFIKVKTFDKNKFRLWYEKVTQHNCMEFQFFTDFFFVITRHVKKALWGGNAWWNKPTAVMQHQRAYFCSKTEFLSSIFLTSKQAKWNPVTEKPMEISKIGTLRAGLFSCKH